MAIIFFGLAAGVYYIFGAFADILLQGGVDVTGTAYDLVMDIIIILAVLMGMYSAWMYKVKER